MSGTEATTSDQRLADPTVTDPGLYRVIFENDRVRVLEYRDRPGDRTVTVAATLETGAVIQVPLFVEQGERIRVDTRSGAYVARA